MRIRFIPRCHIGPEIVAANVSHTKSLGLPYVISVTDRPRLAVCGGAPSIAEHLDELRAWDGDIWACGTTQRYLANQGIKSTFLFIDPGRNEGIMDLNGKAILASCCDPYFTKSGADIQIFDLLSTEERANHSVTTITAAPELAINMGYRDVTFFGADSSFFKESHVDRDDALAQENKLIVEVSSASFVCDPELLMQAEFLAMVFSQFPSIFKSKSGGLLKALIANPEYQITHVAGALKDKLAETPGIELKAA